MNAVNAVNENRGVLLPAWSSTPSTTVLELLDLAKVSVTPIVGGTDKLVATFDFTSLDGENVTEVWVDVLGFGSSLIGLGSSFTLELWVGGTLEETLSSATLLSISGADQDLRFVFTNPGGGAISGTTFNTATVQAKFYSTSLLGLGTITVDQMRMSAATGSAPLPVTYSTLALREEGGVALLQWSTAQELNNDYFSIERSADGRRWETVGQVAGQGTTQEEASYRFMDAPGPGRWYYRLLQVDYDGQSAYSDVLSVVLSSKAGPVVKVVNPVRGQALQLQWAVPPAQPMALQLSGLQGQAVYRAELAPAADWSAALPGLPPGLYVLTLAGQDGELLLTEKIVVE